MSYIIQKGEFSLDNFLQRISSQIAEEEAKWVEKVLRKNIPTWQQKLLMATKSGWIANRLGWRVEWEWRPWYEAWTEERIVSVYHHKKLIKRKNFGRRKLY